jgi:hypothetical protein
MRESMDGSDLVLTISSWSHNIDPPNALFEATALCRLSVGYHLRMSSATDL